MNGTTGPMIAAGIHWGDVPAWVGGVLAGGGVLIAALAYARDSQRRREDLVERRDARLERQTVRDSAREANARKLTVDIDRSVLVIRNVSDEPFYKVKCWVDSHLEVHLLHTLNPGAKATVDGVIPSTPWFLVFQDGEGVFWARGEGTFPRRTDEAAWQGLHPNRVAE
jgi:hypothetical protein